MGIALFEILNGVLEDAEAVAGRAGWFASPARVLRPIDEAFWMRHEAEHAARFVADAGKVALGPVGIGGVGNGGDDGWEWGMGNGEWGMFSGIRSWCVADYELAIVGHTVEGCVVASDEFAFAVGHGEFHLLDALEEHAPAGVNGESDPAGFEVAGIVERERGGGAVGVGGSQKVRLQQHLESVANTDYELARFTECSKSFREVMLDLVAEDAPGGDVVAVAETARDAEYLEIGEALRLFQHVVDVPAFGGAAGQFKGVSGFDIAVGARSSED